MKGEQTHIAERIVLDFAVLAFSGGILSLPFFGQGIAFSFCAGCLWLGLNFAALAWLLSAVAGPLKASRWFIFAVACAKIPLSYLILFWLYRLDYLEPVGLTAGLAMLPAVLIFRGLAEWRAKEPVRGS
jgi:hypothetical protein